MAHLTAVKVHYPTGAIKAYRITPNEPAEASVRPYKPSMRVVAKPILESCTACNENAAYAIPDVCRIAIRNMRPLPCECVLKDDPKTYRHIGNGNHADADGGPDTPTRVPLVMINGKRAGVVSNAIMAYLRESGPATVAEVCQRVTYHRETVVEMLRQMALKGQIYRAKPLVCERYRAACYAVTPIRYEMTVHWDLLDDVEKRVVEMRLDGMTLSVIREKIGIPMSPNRVRDIVAKGITECLVTDDTES